MVSPQKRSMNAEKAKVLPDFFILLSVLLFPDLSDLLVGVVVEVVAETGSVLVVVVVESGSVLVVV